MSLSRFHLCSLFRAAFICALTHSTSSIVVPSDYVQTYQLEQTDGDRRLITEIARDYQTRRDQFLEMVPCIESFLIKYISNPSRSVLLVLDDNQGIDDIAQLLIVRVRDRFAFFTHSPDTDFPMQFDIATSAIVLMSNGSSVKESFYLLDPCDRGCLYVTVLLTKFDDEESFLSDADVLARSMWTRRISILVVLARVHDSVLVAGSLEFESNKSCAPTPPVILDKCDRDAWRNLERIVVPKLNDCILTVSYFEQPPYVIMSNESEYMMGFEGTLTEELIKGLQIDRQRVEWSENTSYVEQVKMVLYDDDNHGADLVIGCILEQSNEDVSYSTSYDTLKVVWVVPKVPNVSLKGLIQPFQTYVWAAIGGALLMGGIIKILLIRDVSWLDIFALIIGVSIARRPTKLSGKIHFIAWSISGLFLAQFYVDSLADQLINVSDLKVETMKELMASFEIGGTTALVNLFKEFEQTDTIIEKVRDKFVTFDQQEYIKQFNDLLDGTNTSFALVAVLNSSRSDAIETAHAYTLTTDVICSFPIALATWRGFPYLHYIDTKINQFVSYGLFDFMIDLAIAKQTRINMFAIEVEQEYKSQLHLQQFVPAFLLMVIGFASGLLFLILEIILYPRAILEGWP
ncbi:uncharacterized protein LOC143184121 [Calliopsis andreniformis]|uniref:uncharacterized protein LOC143184121 n=1 Tax=Calliopsis andreniformis TaxID=337506 RepID=UPI003FCE65C0